MAVAHLTITNASLVGFTILITAILVRKARRTRTTTALKGPVTRPWFGLSTKSIDLGSFHHGNLYEDWEAQYGPVFQLPTLLGLKDVILCDPKAVAHFFSKDTTIYRQTPATRLIHELLFGKHLLWAESDNHKRQRKALSPAFSNSAIRNLTPVFYDSAYALKASWDTSLQSNTRNDGVIIDVQAWMNRVAIDNIGMAGFSHDFGSLSGKSSPVFAAFESLGSSPSTFFMRFVMLFAPLFPWVFKIPSERRTELDNLAAAITNIANELIEKARINNADEVLDRSVIGALIRSENSTSAKQMSSEEIVAQIFLLLIAGYEGLAISLTWVLIELARNPEIQQRLRKELLQFSDGDPSWDQLMTSLPYLDAVTCEILRLHPPAMEIIRQAHEDDVIPLSKPVHDLKGRLVDSIFIAEGTAVRVPIMHLNRSEVIWGKNSKEFLPDRWLDDSVNQDRATEVRGYRHLLTFIDGPRTCLGKGFALSEFKAVLSVLARNFSFELLDGPNIKIERYDSILPRPKVAGQDGAKVPMVVRRIYNGQPT